jgi:phage terminase large subunit
LSTLADFPRKLEFLFKPHEFKIAYGGRAGSKSWNMARALLIISIHPERLWPGRTDGPLILCGRETQKSIKDSVHKLLCDQIKSLGLQRFFVIQKAAILNRLGAGFIFAGLKHNIDNIKSLEGCDIVWVEEAQTVSKATWDKLIPTVRKPGSEIWVSFNPELAKDDTYQRFVVKPSARAKVVKINWRDNPWLSDKSRKEMEELRATDPDGYNHIWEGCPRSTLEGAVYAAQLRAADADQRITRVPHNPMLPTHTFWDLGIADAMSIWCVQAVGQEYHLIDFIGDTGKAIPEYLKILQSKPYVYGTAFLPHDARARELGTGKSVEELIRKAGWRVQIVPQLSVVDGINAARTIFPLCWFDEAKTADGIQALRHYTYEKDEETGQLSNKPKHDENSHAADAFRMFAVGIKTPKKVAPPAGNRPRVHTSPWS